MTPRLKHLYVWSTTTKLHINYSSMAEALCLAYLILLTDATGEVTQVYLFLEEEYRKGIVALKNGKATGIDDVLVKQLNYLGPTLHNWLLNMLNNCLENKVPRLWRVKDQRHPETIQQICYLYKLYARSIFNELQLLKDTSSRNRPALGQEGHAPALCKHHSTHRG